MRTLLISLGVIALLLVIAFLGLLASGVIAPNSLSMILNVMLGTSGPPATPETVERRYQAPPGFTVELYASDLPRVRLLRFTPAGDLLASRPYAGDVVLLRRDRDGDGRPDAVETLIGDLGRPHGLALHDGWLYIAESDRIGRVAFDDAAGALTGAYQPVVEGLTSDGNHWSKTIAFGPDGRLYLAQGSTCNICVEADERRATMMRFEADGTGGEILATGLRNSVGFAWAPWNGALYATDNGRDFLGDHFPPCELNRIEAGGFYGWPYYNGSNVPDPDMSPDPLTDEREPIAPVHAFRPHNAPLGITFPNTAAWPDGFERIALVALHGSWNRSVPDGYKVVSLHFGDDGIRERDFLTGFLQDGDVSGRPVDVVQGPDGAIYVSDDYSGAIYRVHRGAPRAAGTPSAGEPAEPAADATPAWVTAADLDALAAEGAALWHDWNCAECHAPAAGDNAILLDDLAARRGYAQVLDTLAAPPPPMPALPLTEDERRALAVYLMER